MKNDIPTFILPAAGFGKRVGSPEAKELLPDPETGRALIDHSIDLALKCGGRVVVVSRKEKTALNRYIASLSTKNYLIELFLIEGSQEWPESISLAQSCWGEINIVLLPDTRFSPVHTLTEMIDALKNGFTTSFAVFSPESFASWGVVIPQETGFIGCEKPIDSPEVLRQKYAKAWGVFGFRKVAGEKILKYLLVSSLDHDWYLWSEISHFVELEKFTDLTRDLTQFE